MQLVTFNSKYVYQPYPKFKGCKKILTNENFEMQTFINKSSFSSNVIQNIYNLYLCYIRKFVHVIIIKLFLVYSKQWKLACNCLISKGQYLCDLSNPIYENTCSESFSMLIFGEMLLKLGYIHDK